MELIARIPKALRVVGVVVLLFFALYLGVYELGYSERDSSLFHVVIVLVAGVCAMAAALLLQTVTDNEVKKEPPRP